MGEIWPRGVWEASHVFGWWDSQGLHARYHFVLLGATVREGANKVILRVETEFWQIAFQPPQAPSSKWTLCGNYFLQKKSKLFGKGFNLPLPWQSPLWTHSTLVWVFFPYIRQLNCSVQVCITSPRLSTTRIFRPYSPPPPSSRGWGRILLNSYPPVSETVYGASTLSCSFQQTNIWTGEHFLSQPDGLLGKMENRERWSSQSLLMESLQPRWTISIWKSLIHWSHYWVQLATTETLGHYGVRLAESDYNQTVELKSR